MKLLFLLLIIGISLGVGYWFENTPTYSPEVGEDTTNETSNSEVGSSTSTATTTTDPPITDSVPSEEATEISADALTDEQRQMLERFGVDTKTITITPDMVQCAEEAVGAERLTEIQNGDTPGFTESLSLLRCYSQN